MSDWFKTEDWWAVWIGLLIFVLSLGLLGGADLLGWSANTKVWRDDLSHAIQPVSETLIAQVPGWVSLLATYLLLLGVLSLGALALGLRVPRFAASFTVIFWISYGCWLLGHNAYIAATPNQRSGQGVSWSLGLTNEAGYIIALLAGLIIGNFFPRQAGWLQEATRPEWYIKTAIVIMGAALGAKAAAETKLAQSIMFRGFAAIVEAYLIYWALVYFIARRFFKFSREWAAPLASGISICGVSAAIATGAAIRARPVVPVMVSSLVVIFAVIELIVLPFAAHTFLVNEPMVAAAWMGLAVKTDGAAFASGAMTASLFGPDLPSNVDTEWMLTTTTTVKVFIDVFIGIWAFVLALVWAYGINPKSGEKVHAVEIWQRFPKFVLGYFLTFLVALGLSLALPHQRKLIGATTAEANAFRVLFFVMTFFTIGMVSNFRKLWQEGIGRLAAVYVISLFGFIIWIGLAISWIFFHGVSLPVKGGG
jgi:uncharacterized membrane protein YadS